MGMFDGIEAVDVFQKSNYIQPGLLEVEVLACKERNGHSGEAFIVEFRVVSSTNTENPPNSTASWVRKFKTKQETEMSQRAMMTFFVAALGYEVNDDNVAKIKGHIRQLIPRIIGEENMLAGKHVAIEATPIKTREGKDFTQLKFSPVAS